MKLTRRTFLKGTAGAALSGLALERLLSQPAAGAAQTAARWEETWIPTVCLQCPGGCGILVRVVTPPDSSGSTAGRAVKVEGNPVHPVNRGKVCPKANAGLQVLYDPDRVKGPLRQAGPRGSRNWEPISWREALQIVTRRLQELRDTDQPHTVLFMTGRLRGQMGGLIDRFCHAYGTPNHVGHGSLCVDGARIANYLTYGWRELAAYDWEDSNFVLSFGRSFVEASRPTLRQIRAFGYMRRDRPNRRAKFVQIEPRLSVTAAKADEWIPIKPGTDGALALAMANVIVSEGRWDRDFVAEHTFGFDDWVDAAGGTHLGFKSLVLRDYPPRRVQDITDVPAETIVRLAREFAAAQPGVACGGRGTSMQSNGIFTRMAIQALNALVGNIEKPGGVMAQREPPFTPWPDVVLDSIAEEGLRQPRLDRAGTPEHPLATSAYQELPERILAGDPYPVKALFLYYTNPLFSSPDVSRFYQAFEEIPFIVSFSPFLDDSSAMADLILPDHTYLERWQDDVVDPSLGFPVVGLRQPVVEPLHDTMDTGDVLLTIADYLGGTVAASFPWSSFQELLFYRLGGLWQAQRGSIRGSEFVYFWHALRERGVWEDEPYVFGQWARVFQTPSGRFEFYSQHLQADLERVAEESAGQNQSTTQEEMTRIVEELGIRAQGDELFLPHYEPPLHVGDESEYPFHLITYKLMSHAEGRGANSPWLLEKMGIHIVSRWETWVEINPEVARSLGIEDGDWVWVESSLGERIKVRARLYPGTRPDTVNIPFGLGHRSYGRWGSGRGENPNWLVVNESDRLGGTAAWFSTRVKVYRA